MALSNEIRRLETKWQTGNSWPKFLEWLEIKDIRGWSGQRVTFSFPQGRMRRELGAPFSKDTHSEWVCPTSNTA